MSDPSTNASAPATSRRAFLKTSTALAGSAAAGLWLARSAHAAGSDTLRSG